MRNNSVIVVASVHNTAGSHVYDRAFIDGTPTEINSLYANFN